MSRQERRKPETKKGQELSSAPQRKGDDADLLEEIDDLIERKKRIVKKHAKVGQSGGE